MGALSRFDALLYLAIRFVSMREPPPLLVSLVYSDNYRSQVSCSEIIQNGNWGHSIASVVGNLLRSQMICHVLQKEFAHLKVIITIQQSDERFNPF